MKVEAIKSADYSAFKYELLNVIRTFISEDIKVNKIDNMATYILTALFDKYEILKMRYIGVWDDDTNHNSIRDLLRKISGTYWLMNMPTLLAMTNNLSEFSVIPINDSTVKDFEQNADTFSMSENQPIDATENVTTPYIKVKGKTGYTNKETTTHNTVKEALERVAISKETEMCLTTFIETGVRVIVKEYNTAY